MNSTLFGDKQRKDELLIEVASAIQDANTSNGWENGLASDLQKGRSQIKWHALDKGLLILNCDATLRWDEGHVDVGAVVRVGGGKCYSCTGQTECECFFTGGCQSLSIVRARGIGYGKEPGPPHFCS
ncbi:Uncharacterized protein Adt_16091 [Abeliophyllum distichum]|uniref:Uncharacterized protein n=1 Tax=Abeliophyllum distichum TaxID=126358 RepID=A0ABD1TCS2_9LAMI